MAAAAAVVDTGAVRVPDVGDEYDATKKLLKIRLSDASHQNWVFTDEDAKFLEGTPGPAFEQLSIQRLPAYAQRELAKYTGVLSRHASKGKNDETSLQFAAVIAKEVDAGRGKGTKAITDSGKRELLDGISLSCLLHNRCWVLLRKKTGKTNCQLADEFSESKTGEWVLPFYRRVLAKVAGDPTGFEDGADRKALDKEHHAWAFAQRFNCVKGLPEIRAACVMPTKLVVQTPMLEGAPDVKVPSLFDVAYPGGVTDAQTTLRNEPLTVIPDDVSAALEKRRAVLTNECQRVIALRAVALVRIMHAFGWTHGRITPHTMRLDASSMTVYFMDLTDIRRDADEDAAVADTASEPAFKRRMFDLYSLYATFKTAGLDHAAQLVGSEPVSMADVKAGVRVSKDQQYQKYPVWKTQHDARAAAH